MDWLGKRQRAVYEETITNRYRTRLTRRWAPRDKGLRVERIGGLQGFRELGWREESWVGGWVGINPRLDLRVDDPWRRETFD